MEIIEQVRIVEALLFASEKPLSSIALADCLPEGANIDQLLSLEERRSVLDALYDFNIVNENWVVGLFKNRQNVTEIDKNELYAWLDNTLKH